MEDFNLLIKELINKKQININIPEELNNEFEITANNYINKGNLLDAIKIFILIKNQKKLIETAEMCMQEGKIYEAFYGFSHTKNKEKLNSIGFAFLQIPDIKYALESFKKAENKEMVEFLSKNLH